VIGDAYFFSGALAAFEAFSTSAATA